MATFSSVTRHHVLQALAEHDDRGADAFLAVYGFDPTPGHTLRHEGREYDARAVLAVAHRFATGRLATAEEFHGGAGQAVLLLRNRGFEVSAPEAAVRTASRTTAPRTARAPRATRTPATRAAAARDDAPAICPTCSMALPATGVCDDCA